MHVEAVYSLQSWFGAKGDNIGSCPAGVWHEDVDRYFLLFTGAGLVTTVRDLRRLVNPLLADDPDLFTFSRYLAVKPVSHVIVTLAFGYTSTPEEFRVEMCPTFLAVLRPGQYPTIPEQQFFWPEDGFWDIREPDYPDNRQMALKYSLIPEMKMLNNWNAFEELFDRYAQRDVAGYDENKTLMALAHGQWSEAARWLAADRFQTVRRYTNDYSSGLGDRLLERGDDLSIDDKRALIAMLHRREEDAIMGIRQERHWAPSAFPVEVTGLV